MSGIKGSNTGGFTLIELLASLVVLALLSLMLVAGVGGRTRAWARMDRDTTNGEIVESAQALMRARLQHTWPIILYNRMPPGPDFDGAQNHVVFLAPPPQSQGPAALRRYQLALDAGGDLVLDSVSDLALDRHHWTERQVLLHGVQTLDIGYFGTTLSDHTAHWRPSWSSQTAMPALVRVRVAFAPGDARVWPDLIVHPAADIDAGCILVVATGGCRGR